MPNRRTDSRSAPPPPGRPPRPASALREPGHSAASLSAADPVVTDLLTDWFLATARPLPWRTDAPAPPHPAAPSPIRPRNPWHALVSEAMLQQTQVSRVVEYFHRFIARFPAPASLAAAAEADVLALWSGLGYYRRARNLRLAAQAIVERHNGQVPSQVEELRELPGVGPYTAGAIASIVFGQPVPLVDGNVTRVLLRLHGQDLDPAAKATTQWTWAAAGRLAAAAERPGPFNEGLMELGATVCLPSPAAPRCDACPLQSRCAAFATGTQSTIPRPKPAKTTSTIHCAAVVITARNGRIRLVRRPAGGLWGGLWQVPTVEVAEPAPQPDLKAVLTLLTVHGGDPASLTPAGQFVHQTTHRTLRFTVYTAAAVRCHRKAAAAQWADPARLGEFGVSSATRRVLGMAAQPPLFSATPHQKA